MELTFVYENFTIYYLCMGNIRLYGTALKKRKKTAFLIPTHARLRQS